MTLSSLFPIWATDLVNVSAKTFALVVHQSRESGWMSLPWAFVCRRYQENRARMPLLFKLHFHLLFGNSDTLNSWRHSRIKKWDNKTAVHDWVGDSEASISTGTQPSTFFTWKHVQWSRKIRLLVLRLRPKRCVVRCIFFKN